MTYDRGYRKESMIRVLTEFGLCFVFIIPEHVLRCHSFAAKSYFIPYREDLQVESETKELWANGSLCFTQDGLVQKFPRRP